MLARLVGSAEQIRDSLGSIWEEPERSMFVKAIDQLRTDMGSEAYEAAWRTGHDRDVDSACREGRSALAAAFPPDRLGESG